MARNGTGVRKASESSIQIEFEYQGKRCRERIKLKPTPANLKRAELHRQQILDAIELGTFDYATTFPNSKRAKEFIDDEITVEAWLKKWLDSKEAHIKASTYTGYTKAINKISSGLGDIPLSKLRKIDVKRWCEQQTCTNKTLSNILSPLRSALQDAIDEEIISENPLRDFRFRRNEAPASQAVVDPFNKDEQIAILSVLSGQHKNLIQFALWTGMRTSELVALEWSDIDFIRGTAFVQRAKTQYSKRPEKTKTASSVREVKLLTPALEALSAQKQHTFIEGERIFKNPNTGKPWTGDQQIRKFWKWALKRAGVRYRKPYQTRHTYASMMLSAGEPLAWVSSQMGHSTVIITAKTYAKWIPDSQPLAGEKAVGLFSEQSLKKRP